MYLGCTYPFRQAKARGNRPGTPGLSLLIWPVGYELCDVAGFNIGLHRLLLVGGLFRSQHLCPYSCILHTTWLARAPKNCVACLSRGLPLTARRSARWYARAFPCRTYPYYRRDTFTVVTMPPPAPSRSRKNARLVDVYGVIRSCTGASDEEQRGLCYDEHQG